MTCPAPIALLRLAAGKRSCFCGLTSRPTGTVAAAAAPDFKKLSLELGDSIKNVYTIYGEEGNVMSIPAAYQADAPFGANTGGVAAAFVAAVPTTAFDSWLTVGITGGDSAGAGHGAAAGSAGERHRGCNRRVS